MLIPPGEKVVEKKKCLLSGRDFIVTDRDLEFYEKISPVFAGKKYSLPTPTLCPDERQRRRLAFRNERHLYSRVCDKTGKQIISVFSPEKPFIVYNQKSWWADDWSPLEYGIAFDSEKNFFEQFRSLILKVPKANIYTLGNENCDYVTQCGYSKNCYLCSNTDFSEDCIYTTNCYKCRDCRDSFLGQDNEHCYNLVESNRCHSCMYMFSSESCRDSAFLSHCTSCDNCFGCTNLQHKSYHIFNTPYSKEDYANRIGSLMSQVSQDSFRKFLGSQNITVRPNIIGSENAIGDTIHFSKNIFYGFDVERAENSRYVTIFSHGRDCYDYDIGGYQSELCHELVSSGDSNFNSHFVTSLWSNTQNVWYSDIIRDAHDIFGCTGVRNAHHCILNTSYSTQEYEMLCGKIIDHMISTGEWGEFFPHELSPFGYNETVAQEYFPMTEEEIKAKRWNWYTETNKVQNNERAENILPLRISEYDEKIVGYETAQKNIDTLLNGIILCEVTHKPFKIIKQELAFYIEHSLPIPTKHPDQRHKERMDLRNPRTLYERICAECRKEIITTYSPERPERVVCEECYRKTVY